MVWAQLRRRGGAGQGDGGDGRSKRAGGAAGWDPIAAFLDLPAEALINLGRHLRRTNLGGDVSTGLSSPEAPSAILALSLEVRRLRPGAKLAVAAGAIPEPDPRHPLRPVATRVWGLTRDGRPGPLGPRPTAGVVDVVAAVAALATGDDADEPRWRVEASDIGRLLGPNGIPDLLATMVYPPPVPDTLAAWVWLRAVQMVAALAVAGTERGWEGSARCGALLDLAYGPMDWTGAAALAAMGALALSGEEPAVASELPGILADLSRCRPSFGAWTLRPIVVPLAVRLGIALPEPADTGGWMAEDEMMAQVARTEVLPAAGEADPLEEWERLARAHPDDPRPRILLAAGRAARGDGTGVEADARAALRLLRAADATAQDTGKGEASTSAFGGGTDPDAFVPGVRRRSASMAHIALADALQAQGRFREHAVFLAILHAWAPGPASLLCWRLTSHMLAGDEQAARAALDELLAPAIDRAKLAPTAVLWLALWHERLLGAPLVPAPPAAAARQGLERLEGSARRQAHTAYGAALCALLPELRTIVERE